MAKVLARSFVSSPSMQTILPEVAATVVPE
jgi:hypothetical protein